MVTGRTSVLPRVHDGKTFTRVLQPNGNTAMFGDTEENNTRDPDVIKVGGTYYLYYAEDVNGQCGDYCRSSSDFKTWSAPKEVAFGGSAGTGRVAAECPFVVNIAPGEYYLFRTQNYAGVPQTSVYFSTNPLDFGIDDDKDHFVCTLPVAAPEIVSHHGAYYIAALLPNLQGIRVSPLTWSAAK